MNLQVLRTLVRLLPGIVSPLYTVIINRLLLEISYFVNLRGLNPPLEHLGPLPLIGRIITRRKKHASKVCN